VANKKEKDAAQPKTAACIPDELLRRLGRVFRETYGLVVEGEAGAETVVISLQLPGPARVTMPFAVFPQFVKFMEDLVLLNPDYVNAMKLRDGIRWILR
jgi:hypothetical protein